MMVKLSTHFCLWLVFCIENSVAFLYDVTLTNNGPVVWGSNITFDGVLLNALNATYDWIWDDGVSRPVTIKSNLNCQLQRVYENPGNYNMKVTLEYYKLPLVRKTNNFQIDATIPGHIELFAYNETTPLDHNRYLETGSEVTIRTFLYDPSDFFANATVLYWLYVDSVLVTQAGPSFTYKLTSAGDFRVMVFVNAYSTSNDLRWASYHTTVKIRDPIHHINITGNTFLQRGEMVELIADCDGSSPWVYCWKPFDNDNTTEKEMSCSNVVTTNKCNFQIQYYFHETGNHKILVNITNDVKRFTRIVHVNIFNVLPEPDLSIIIIPVVFGLLAITIIVVGLLYFIQVRRRFTIEVADFDFMSSESIIYQTFFEQLKDAVVSSLPNSNRFMDRGWNFLDCRADGDTLSISTNGSDISEFKVSEGTVEVATAMPLP